MNELSILAVNIDDAQLKPLREKLASHICMCYGMKALHKKAQRYNVKESLSVIPDIVSGFWGRLSTWGLVPQYYAYLYRIKTLDWIFANRIAKDNSKIIYTSSLFNRTISKAKKAGKIVVISAGNSEATREYNRIRHEYDLFNIKHRYIYGDKRFCDSRLKGLAQADFVITISEVSRKTYSDAGCDMSKFKLIPLTGTDFPIHYEAPKKDRKKAFISTAFHNFVKGTQRLLLAWQKADIESVPLVIVGRQCEDIQEFVRKYGPFKNVQFLGYVKGSLQDFYREYDAVGVLMSLSEGAVRTTPELMSFGFPMIVSPDATCDLVEDGRNGFVVDPFDDKLLVERLRWFAEDWNRVNQLREDVLSSVSNRTMRDFSLDVADYLEELM